MTVLFISSIFCPSSHIALFLLFKAVCCWIALFTDSFVNTRSTALCKNVVVLVGFFHAPFWNKWDQLFGWTFLVHSFSSGNNFFTSASLDQFYKVFLYDMAYYTIFVNVLRRLHVYMQPTLVDISDEHFKLDKVRWKASWCALFSGKPQPERRQ